MPSLKELKARAKKYGFKVIAYKKPLHGRYYYKLDGFHCRNVKELAEALRSDIRRAKTREMFAKLNGHRPKYGYKTVPRKKRG